jgi:hypothetical protein
LAGLDSWVARFRSMGDEDFWCLAVSSAPSLWMELLGSMVRM